MTYPFSGIPARACTALAALLVFAAPSSAQMLSSTSVWTQDDVASESIEASDQFGHAVTTGDFNNDGFADLAVGVPLENLTGAVNSGVVNIIYGTRDGLSSVNAQTITQDDITGSANEASDQFGWSLASGDFNDDGFDDLAIGVPFEDVFGVVDAGNVAIVLGSATGLYGSSTFISEDGLPNSETEANNRFGWSLASGDFDNDGYDDLAVGVPLEDFAGGVTNTGAIGVFYGSSSGITDTGSEPISQTSIDTAINEIGDQMGYSLAVADFDDDGFDDLAVGIPFENPGDIVDAGMVAVLFGSNDGLVSDGDTDSELFSQASMDDANSQTGDQFGSSLAAGDFDNDGHADLAIGAPFEDLAGGTDTGIVGVFYGSNAGLLPADTELLTQEEGGDDDDDNDRFGAALCVADFDGDGYDDLVASTPGERFSARSEAGHVTLFFGSEDGLLPERTMIFAQDAFGGEPALREEFGTAMTCGDFDGNGLIELAVSAPLENIGTTADAGTVSIGSLPDSDGDGLLDLEEINTYGTDPLKADTDSDGSDDGAELLAGTDPLDPASRPGIRDLTYISLTGQVIITWGSVPGRSYQLEWSEDLSESSWSAVFGATNVPAGPGAVTSFVDTTPQGTRRRFYRVRVVGL